MRREKREEVRKEGEVGRGEEEVEREERVGGVVSYSEW